MSMYGNLTEFFGKPVRDFQNSGDIADFGGVAPRIRNDWEDESRRLADMLGPMLDEPGGAAIEALVFGFWNEHGAAGEATPAEAIELLVSRKSALPNLKALFIGDIISEENEISWINHDDLSAIWGAFPGLEHVVVRGANGLRLGQINHPRLNTLILQSGGLPAPLVREALAANAPLTHLELWLGEQNYGSNTTVADFSALLAGELFPQLKRLGLCNSDYQDDIAEAMATAPIVERLEALDLSKGVLTDRGAQALAQSGRLGHLKKLDISHHFVSEEAVAALSAATPALDASDPQEADVYGDDVYRYVFVSE